MTHNLGSVIPVGQVFTGASTFEPPGPTGRFVMLHFDASALGTSGRLEVDLEYDTDVFTESSGPEIWTRPINPALGPISIRVIGGGTVRLVEFGRAEPTIIGVPGAGRGSQTNPDPFLQTDPYEEPIYETRLECNPGFAWENAACAPTGSAQERVAASVGIVFLAHDGHVSSCSGTLIAGDLFLTSRHCFTDPARGDIRSASVTFDYQTLCFPDGGRPTAHSPRFFKVVEDVLSGAPPTGTEPPTVDDWVVLRLNAAPGAMPPPVPIRDSVPTGAETVFTMHHPNGAVKKTQLGSWDGAGSVSGFDFAGGSSGSALFDGAGNLIAGPLSTGGGCFVSFTPHGQIIDALENPPVPPSPLDVIIVFDKSGSMGSTAPPIDRTKLEEAQDAAALFVSLVREAAGDRIGLVSFNQGSSLDQAPGLVASVRPSLVGGAPFNTGLVGDITSGGTTSVGAGLQAALTAMSGTTNQRAILLLSDGLQNRTPFVETVEGALGDTILCVVGFGSDAEIDGPLLNRIARDHNGQFTRAVDGLTLRKFFGQCFGNIFAAGELADPNRTLLASETISEELPISVCDEERLTIILGWDNRRSPLRAHIRTPDGRQIADDVESVRGLTWAFWQVELPQNGEREGTWGIAVDRVPYSGEFPPPPSDVEYFLSVIASAGPTLTNLDQPQRVYTGDTLQPLVALHYPDRTTPHGASVTLELDAPDAALGALVLDHGLVDPEIGGDSPNSFYSTLQRIQSNSDGLPVPRRKASYELFDDGVHEDGAMEPDGIFGNLLDDVTQFEGTYELRAIAQYGDDCIGTREATWSIHVEPGIDPTQTTVELVDEGAGTGTLVVTPRDIHGNPLGPGRGERFTATPMPEVAITGPTEDRRDGSYGIPVDWDPSSGAVPGVVINQPDRHPVCIQLVGAKPHGCPRWLCVLLAISTLALLIVAIALLI